MILHSENDHRGGGRSTTAEQDFTPPPTYTQSTTQNDSWVNVTVTRTDSDGSRSQVSFIEKK